MEPLLLREPDDLTLAAFEEVVFARRTVTLDPGLLATLDRVRQRALDRLQGPGSVYGVNTGVGYLADVRLSEAEQAAHQHNLLLGRAVGGPPYLDPVEVRALLLARLAGFVRGHAGVSAQLCQFLADRLNDDFLPAIPRRGIGCAGEIIPNCHAFQTLMGVGFVLTEGGLRRDAAAALTERRVAAYEPGVKEGIALLNGAPGSLALAIVRHAAARTLADQLLVAAAGAIEAIRAPMSAYGEPVARLANDPHMGEVLERLRTLLRGADAMPGATQAPVSFRVVPQVHAHLWRTLGRVKEDINRALHASDDSPAFIDDAFLSTGNFHAIGLAAGMDAMALALIQAGELAGQHIHRLLDKRFSGLPDQLTSKPGPNAGLIVVQKRVAGTIHELHRLALPASIGLVDTSLGQEDAMTFGYESADRLRQVETLVREVVACALLTIHQAGALRGKAVAAGLSRTAELLEETVRPVEEDRPLGGDIERLVSLLTQGAFAAGRPGGLTAPG
ncbi:MAG: aromatic amino acid lyase [Candidatus Dormibacteraeota bacterium]|nr:aromatic amino acid lyase [Candidatus Dormibacteraeota bacterium]